ncbi:MAG TPA: AsmA family protein, partial [Gammaproteobacteria bacterium]|nr:AsmA family protein [Gammaproteobacteria bacterium]
MMKRFLIITAGFITLILVVVLGFALTLNPNDYKDDIVTLVKENTGRTLSINGDISLSLFPWIGLELGETEISNAKGFGKKPFAKISRLQVRAKLWPLFSQRLEADTLVLEGLTLNLAKNKHGISNWDDLTAPAKITTQATKTQKEPKAKTSNVDKLAVFALNGVKIINAQFNWDDKQQKQKVNVSDVNLSLGAIRTETKIPFNL